MIFKYLITILIFYNILRILSATHHGINVGTVLFTDADNSRKCWSSEQLALLRTRLVFQDVLPKSQVLTMEDDQFVSVLLNYFRMTLEKTKSSTAGKTKQINLMALADTLGGYLHHLVLPLGKRAFYAGKICLNSIAQLEDLYIEIKNYLRTDGHNWNAPIKPSVRIKRAHPLDSSNHQHDGEKDCCYPLIYSCHSNGTITIQIPFLDSKSAPTSIAIPYKKNPLRNIRSKSSAFIIEKFYRTAIDCMNEKNAKSQSIDNFNIDFSKFLDIDVLPHLDDEDLYPAFGNVLRVRETIKNGGQEPCTAPHHKKVTSEENDYYSDEDKSTTVMFIAVGVVILIWILTGIIYCCCRMRRQQHDKNIAAACSMPKVVLPGALSSLSGPHVSASGAGPAFITSSKTCRASDSAKSTCAVDKHCSQTLKQASQHGQTVVQPPAKSSTTGKQISAQKVQVAKCGKCKRTKCTHTVVAPVLVTSSTIKGVKSAPASLKKERTFVPEKINTKSSNSNESGEKPVVFGYDFETSSSDSSSLEDTSSSSGQNTPKRKT